MGKLLIFDKPAYSIEDFKMIKRHNRELYRRDEKYIAMGAEDRFEINYIISIFGTKYYLADFYRGLMHIKKHYGVKIPVYTAFLQMYSQGVRLPVCFDYACRVITSDYNATVYYVSTKARFETSIIGEDRYRVKVDYGTEEDIEYAINSRFF